MRFHSSLPPAQALPPITAVRDPYCRADRLHDAVLAPHSRSDRAPLRGGAAIAGYHAALGLAHIGISAEGWRQVMAVMGAIAVAATAWAPMVLSAPCPTPD